MQKKQRRPQQKSTTLKADFLKSKTDKPLADLSRNQGRRIKSTNLEMKMERSQQTTLTYKGL